VGGGFAVKFQGLQILRYGALGQIARSSKVKESGKVIWKVSKMNLDHWMILKILKVDHWIKCFWTSFFMHKDESKTQTL
jgi:hypothetical protein